MTATFKAPPMAPEPNRQHGNPENVPYVEAAHRDGSALRPAGHAVVVAKGNSFGTPVVSATNNEHERFN